MFLHDYCDKVILKMVVNALSFALAQRCVCMYHFRKGEGASYFIGYCVFFGNSEGGHGFSVNLISASDKTVKIL